MILLLKKILLKILLNESNIFDTLKNMIKIIKIIINIKIN